MDIIKKIMYKSKLFFRNKSVTILLIMGLLVSYFIIINGVAMLGYITEAQKKNEIEIYKNERKVYLMKASYNGTKEGKEMVDRLFANMTRRLATGKGNLMFEGYPIYIADSLKKVYADFIYHLEGELNKPLLSGRMPTEEEIRDKKKVILISQDMEKYIEKKDGKKKILISNNWYEVIGIFETHDITVTRADAILFMESFTDEEIEKLINSGFPSGITVSYSGSITEQDYKELVGKIRSFGQIAKEEVVDEDRLNTNRILLNKIFMGILFVFSIINCAAITNVWINSRVRELVIRKTMGYSMMQIIGNVISDLLKYSGVSVILALILQYITSHVLSQDNMNLQYSSNTFLYLIISVVGIITFSLLDPIIKLKYTLPAKKING